MEKRSLNFLPTMGMSKPTNGQRTRDGKWCISMCISILDDQFTVQFYIHTNIHTGHLYKALFLMRGQFGVQRLGSNRPAAGKRMTTPAPETPCDYRASHQR